MKEENVKKAVRERYGKFAKQGSSCCGTSRPSCGGEDTAKNLSKAVGYSKKEMDSVPDGANLGLGCGNPVALSALRSGETVLDLGSGAGFDCFLAAKKVGKKGHVIGVDMTHEMLEKARENAKKGRYGNVEFRLGEIENLPVADGTVDVVISNCVINLSTDKQRVFKEAYRALRPGGRLMVSDMVVLKELPENVKDSIEAYVGCVSGAMKKDEYLGAIKKAGFKKVKVLDETTFPIDCMSNDPTVKGVIEDLKIPAKNLKEIASSVVSVKVSGVK